MTLEFKIKFPAQFAELPSASRKKKIIIRKNGQKRHQKRQQKKTKVK
jgi:hypothetical protein